MSEPEELDLELTDQYRQFEINSDLVVAGVLNILVEALDEIVRENLFPEIGKSFKKLNLDSDEKDEVRQMLVDGLLKRKKNHNKKYRNKKSPNEKDLVKAMREFKETLDRKVRAISSKVVLTNDIENAKLEKRGKAGDEEAQLERIKVQREELLQLRIEIEMLKQM